MIGLFAHIKKFFHAHAGSPPFVIFLALFLLLSPNIFAQAGSVTILYVKGDPQIMKAGTQVWESCVTGAVVSEGDAIKTKAKEAVELSFGTHDENIVNIEEYSHIVIARLSAADKTIELVNGEALTLMRRLPARSTFEVKTPAGISGARGTGWGTTTNGRKMTASSFENSIYVKGVDASGKALGEAFSVTQGWKTSVDRFKKPSRLERLSVGERRRWHAWKRSLLKRTGRPSRRVKRIDKVGALNKKIESLLDRKESFKENKDLDRIERRQEKTFGSSSGRGGQGGVD